jgi:FixJ family two-component response regulator
MDGLTHALQTAIAVVDDDADLRDWMQRMLGQRGYRAQLYADGESFLAMLPRTAPRCILLDLQMPGLSGLQLLQTLVRRPDAPPVIMVTAHGDVASARNALKLGAVDFIEKPVAVEELLAAIDEALAQQDEVRQRRQAASDARTRVGQLTERERQVFIGVTDGLNHQEIGETLNISPRTVEVHRGRMMDRLGLKRPADLFRLRFELGE